jgi:Ca2+/Na+ antiporter
VVEVVEIFIPIVMFIGLTVVLSLFVWFRFRIRNDAQSTIRTAIEKGQELTPEIIDRLGHPRPHEDRDLRISLIYFALAIALTLFGVALPVDEEHAQRVFMGIAAFPFSLGVAFLIMWRFTERRS